MCVLHGAGAVALVGICGWIAGEPLDHVVSFFRCTPILGGALANITRMYELLDGHLPVLDASSDSRSPMDVGDAVAVACSTNCRARDIRSGREKKCIIILKEY